MSSLDAIIIGGGIAGLSAAYELRQRDIGFVVLERASRPGGVILSEEIDGFTIDAGPDSLLVQKPDGIRLCEELGLGAELVSTRPPRLAYIQRGGRLHPLPASSVLGIPTRIRPFVTTDLFSWGGKLRMAAEVGIPARRDEADESIGAFMTRRFGAEATTYLAEPLLAGIHAGDVDRLSVRSLFPRFVNAEREYGSLLRAFRAQPRGPASVGGAFRSLPGGLSQMIRALVARLPAGSVHLDAAVRRVSIGETPPRFSVEIADGERISASAVICATPAYVTGALVRELAGLCVDVPYASTATVVMAFERSEIAHPLNGSGFVVPRVERSGILAGSWMSSKWPHRAPADKVLLRAFVGGARDPDVFDRPDAELVRLSLAALTPLLGVTGPPLLTRVYRWPRTSAQHEVGHAARVRAIEQALAGQPGLFVTGSGFRGVGIPDCVADGRATGKQVAQWLAGTSS
jgi:oxygen-dependent protoporphyrinogen oxidase